MFYHMQLLLQNHQVSDCFAEFALVLQTGNEKLDNAVIGYEST